MVWIDFLMLTFALVIAWIAWALVNLTVRKPSPPAHTIEPTVFSTPCMPARKCWSEEASSSFLDTYDGSYNNG